MKKLSKYRRSINKKIFLGSNNPFEEFESFLFNFSKNMNNAFNEIGRIANKKLNSIGENEKQL